MKNYYVYEYLREDGTPYYVGKGKNNRAFVNNPPSPQPPPATVEIICPFAIHPKHIAIIKM